MNLDFLRGPSNTSVDSARLLFFIGGLSAIFAPLGFEVWAMHHDPKAWDVTAFCLAYGGLLTAYILGGTAGIKLKDTGVATYHALTPPNAASDT